MGGADAAFSKLSTQSMPDLLVLRHVRYESLGSLEGVFRGAGLGYEYVDLADDSARAFDPRTLAGLVVLGGPMNVDETDEHPHLATEVSWLRAAVADDLPILGLCLGAQLLAKSLGAAVRPNGVKEIGWYAIETTSAAAGDRLFAHFRSRETVFQWHGDTFDLPPGAVQLARSEQCPQQAFRFGRAAYGLQFHLEVTANIVDEWLGEPGNHCEVEGLAYIDAREIRARTPRELPGMTALGEKLFGEFAAICLERNTTTRCGSERQRTRKDAPRRLGGTEE